MPVKRLADGQAFHKQVQSAFLGGLTGAAGFPERHWRLLGQRRGRVDLAVEVEGEQMLVIIEIKGTNWDLIPADRLTCIGSVRKCSFQGPMGLGGHGPGRDPVCSLFPIAAGSCERRWRGKGRAAPA